MKENFNFHGDEHDKEIDKILDEFREDNNLNSDDKDKSIGKYDFDMFMPKSASNSEETDFKASPSDALNFGADEGDTFIDDDFVIKHHEHIPADGIKDMRTNTVALQSRAVKSGKKGRKGKKKRSNAWIVSVIVQIGLIVGLSVFF